MQLSIILRAVGLFFIVLAALPSHAVNEISTIHSNARALGMGDAFTALASDSSSLFYNPAGLARVSGLNWKFLGARVGLSGLSAYTKLQDLSGGNLVTQMNELYGEQVSVAGAAETLFTAPMIGFGIYNHTDVLIKIDNPIYPQAYTGLVSDYGYVLGFGVPFTPFLHAGASLKYIKRSGTRFTNGPADLADLDAGSITSRMTEWGRGYGLDAGLNFVIPAPFFTFTLGAAWKNIGGLTFRSSNADSDIPSDENDVTLGMGLLFSTPVVSVTPSIDVRYLNSSRYQLMRKLNFGVEIGLPLVDIRGGFREGYYTAGVGFNIGLLKLDAATYGIELGAYPGQIEDRRYMLELTLEFGVGNFTASGASTSSSEGGRSGSSSSSSFWGGPGRLKRRR